MTVNRTFAGGKVFEVTAPGHELKGEIQIDGTKIDVNKNIALRETLVAGLLCNDSQLTRKESRLHVEGDPTEAALLLVAQKAQLDKHKVEQSLPRLGVIPFESEHMYMATLHRAGEEKRHLRKGFGRNTA